MISISLFFLFTFTWACIWPLLLAAILPFFLGYLFRNLLPGKDRERVRELENENKKLREQLNHFEQEQASLKYKQGELEKDIDALRTALRKSESDRAVLEARLAGSGLDVSGARDLGESGLRLASASDISFTEEELQTIRDDQYGALFASDNLQVIEGIGPKVEQILKENGIADWGTLAFTSANQLREILKTANLAMIDPGTWPRQADLAREGKWNELANYQQFLDGGSESRGDFDNPAKIDQLALATGQLSRPAVSPRDSQINYAALFAEDNLQIVEGIGPKVDKLLKDNGIGTWQALSEATPENLRALLGQNKMKMMNPDSWPQQAKLAAGGQWAELVEFQKFLDGGRATTGDFESDAKVENMAVKLLGFATNPEDLKIVEGIGPKIEELLKTAGINNWADLAAATEAQLQGILQEAGDRYRLARPGTWPRQAALARDGQWEELRNYQDFLQGGKDPD